MRGYAAWYGIVVGLLMIAGWVNALRTGAWSRSDRAPAELAFHLVGEGLTALWCIAGGLALIGDGSGAEPFALVGFGLLYTSS